jgi:hypothetical protein
MISIEDISTDALTSRRLEQILVINFEFTVESKCTTASCNNSDAISETIATGTKQGLENAISNGNLFTKLKKKWEEKNIGVIVHDQVGYFVVTNVTCKVTNTGVHKDLTDENVSSATNILIFLLVSYVIMVYVLIM